MKRKLTLLFTTLVLSFTVVIGAVYANEKIKEKVTVYKFEGKEYQTIGVETYIDEVETDIKLLEKIEEEENRSNDFYKLKNIIQSKNPDILASSYVDEDGNAVYQFTVRDEELEKELLSTSQRSNKVKFEIVKYKESELKEAQNVIAEIARKENLAIAINAIDLRNNKVLLFMSKEDIEKNKAIINKIVSEDIIKWEIGEFYDQAANIFPGEQIERKDGSQYVPCSAAFTAKSSNNSNMLFTAGHCLNGDYYDLSDQTGTIGKMSNSSNSSLYKYDAGSVSLNSSASRSVILNGSTRTIGTIDYNQARLNGSYSMYLHATSAGGTSKGPGSVISSSVIASGGPTDLVMVSDVGHVGGDSGGLWYSLITKNNKTYAVVEGIHKGIVTSTAGNYAVFSKAVNIYDGFGLTGIYVDSTY